MKNVEQTAFALLQAEKRRKELEIETPQRPRICGGRE